MKKGTNSILNIYTENQAKNFIYNFASKKNDDIKIDISKKVTQAYTNDLLNGICNVINDYIENQEVLVKYSFASKKNNDIKNEISQKLKKICVNDFLKGMDNLTVLLTNSLWGGK